MQSSDTARRHRRLLRRLLRPVFFLLAAYLRVLHSFRSLRGLLFHLLLLAPQVSLLGRPSLRLLGLSSVLLGSLLLGLLCAFCIRLAELLLWLLTVPSGGFLLGLAGLLGRLRLRARLLGELPGLLLGRWLGVLGSLLWLLSLFVLLGLFELRWLLGLLVLLWLR